MEATEAFEAYDYASAKGAVERFFWRDLSDNYLEMVKKRLYGDTDQGRHVSAKYTLHRLVSTVIKLWAPFLPYVTEAIYRELFSQPGESIHRASWPVVEESLVDDEMVRVGEELVAIATAIRRYKTESQLRLGAEVPDLVLAPDDEMRKILEEARLDITCVSRAQLVSIQDKLPGEYHPLEAEGRMKLAIKP